MPSLTTRLSLPYPLLSESADVPRDIGNLATALDNAVLITKGILTSRPAAGVSGREYLANDGGDATADLWKDYGAGWRKISQYQTNGNMSISGHHYPTTDNTFDLGITATNRWRDIYASGAMRLSGGTSFINFTAQTAGNFPILLNRTGDLQNRYALKEDGVMEWGTGAVVRDTNLYRSGVAVLKTDGALIAASSSWSQGTAGLGFIYGPATAAGIAFRSLIGAEANGRFQIDFNGVHAWGSAGAALDSAFFRSGAAQFDFTNNSTGYATLRYASSTLIGTTTANPILKQFLLSTDSQPTFQINGDGRHLWGIGGTTAIDAILARTAAGQLAVGNAAALTAPTSNAMFGVINSGNSIEWGHANPAGFRGMLGADVGGGNNFIALHGEAGTTAGTYRTRGIRASIIRSDGIGGFQFSNVANASLDNQAAVVLSTLSNAGVMTTSGFTAPGLATVSSAAYQASVTGDTVVRYLVGADGKINWGPGGAAAVDTNLYRGLDPNSSADIALKTDNSFVITKDPANPGPIATGATALWINFHLVGLRRVVAGAADSAGVGSRMLMIAN